MSSVKVRCVDIIISIYCIPFELQIRAKDSSVPFQSQFKMSLVSSKVEI